MPWRKLKHMRERHAKKLCTICPRPALGRGHRCKGCLAKDAERHARKRAQKRAQIFHNLQVAAVDVDSKGNPCLNRRG